MSPGPPRNLSAGETESSAEEPPYSRYEHYKEVQADWIDAQRTDYGDQPGTTATSSIAEGGAPPVSVAAASSGSVPLPTPRTEAAEALERLTLRPQPPAPDQ